MASLIDKSLTWKDIAWLRSVTSLKIVVKGVMTAEDALTAVRNGVDGNKIVCLVITLLLMYMSIQRLERVFVPFYCYIFIYNIF